MAERTGYSQSSTVVASPIDALRVRLARVNGLLGSSITATGLPRHICAKAYSEMIYIMGDITHTGVIWSKKEDDVRPL